eukprot:TRINITY_DN1961_c0_g1_i2.p1 TRINITY_DN1961_c0_g1~~TRINITY_DN1961_c0_g1_i2.p1  ORF type:complete len:363 (-),score=92.20 TRINITY_DN1961_c0_g1_i2:440-1528(-)
MSEIATPQPYFSLHLSDENREGLFNPLLPDFERFSTKNGTEKFVDQRFVAGFAYLNEENTVEYIPGNIPLVIAVPHGGYLLNECEDGSKKEFQSLPIRSSGCHEQDIFTQELSRQILLAFGKNNQDGNPLIPHMIICRAHRSQVDMNRDRENASDNEMGRKAWDDYQHCILRSKYQIIKSQSLFEKKEISPSCGLFLDLHGQSHDPRHQIGYVLRGDLLKTKSDEELDSDSSIVEGSSIFGVLLNREKKLSKALRGQESLGGLLESEGFQSVPSPASPHSGDVLYFNGGYCTFFHGSSLVSLQKKKEAKDELTKMNTTIGTLFSAIQIESGYLGVRDSHKNRVKFAKSLVKVLSKWMKLYLE